MQDMVIASLLKIWHLIPIIIFIILFKKFINHKEKKRRINKNEENENNGLSLEVRTQRKYENLGYKVKYNKKQDDKKDQEVDIICYKDEKILLFKCKNYSKAKSIRAEDIESFHDNARNYLKINDIEDKNVEFRYVIPYSDVLHKSAIKLLVDDSYNCKYVVL